MHIARLFFQRYIRNLNLEYLELFPCVIQYRGSCCIRTLQKTVYKRIELFSFSVSQ